ncbi:hypothetical protein [uncultured Helicobacter sp.]|uniref:hypothetical protein n=1 Tax=uncultured Helicobacter sp. TaxID=175537 RepID=UPI003753CD85
MRNKISLVLAGLLGSGLLVADEANAQQATQAPSEVKKTLGGFFDGMEAKGFARARYTTIDGAGGTGADQQYRMKLDITTGKVDGYSFTGGMMFNYGTTAVTPASHSNGAAQGSMATIIGKGYNDRFGIATFSVNKEIISESSKTEFNVGRLNLSTVFTNNTTDLGTGGKVRLKTNGGITYGADVYGSWITSHVMYNLRDSAFGGLTNNTSSNNTSVGGFNHYNGSLGNDLLMLSIKGDKVADSGLSFNASLGYANRLLDYLAFVDAKYDFGGFYVLGQVSAAGMASNPNFMTGGGDKLVNNWVAVSQSQLGQGGFNGFGNNSEWAKTRGIYNIQVGYKSKEAPMSAKLGYLGSFGDGYGTLLDSRGGIDIVGKFWVDNYDATNEGFGFMGAGGRKGTSIQVAYAAIDYAFAKSWKIGLDYSYVTGNNNYPFVRAAVSQAAKNAALAGKGVSFHEVAPSITFKPIKNITAVALYARNFGDVNYGKGLFEIRYDF